MKKLTALGAAAMAAAMVRQHLLYRRTRREVIGDRQALVYAQSTFHVLTFVALDDKEGIIDRVRALVAQVEAEGATLIYAGQAVFVLHSDQIGVTEWDAVLLVQYPSREAYQHATLAAGVEKELRAFTRTYSHGMTRPAGLNLLMPQFLLGLRSLDLLRRNPPEPLRTADEAPTAEGDDRTRIDALRSHDSSALVVVNLIAHGDEAQQRANRAYGLRMLRRMAAGAHGPIHLGSAVTLDGGADFDDVALVHYPGSQYFAELVSSEFFQSIIGDKQLRDTQAVPTVPIIDQI
ncbi:MAG: hypothetical protein AAF567_01530 [Actinomycetota bacterium]